MNVLEFDVRAYLDELGVPFWEEGKNVASGWIGVQCLYCNDHHNHLGISLAYKNFSCWLCNEKGSITQFICDLENVPYRSALNRIDEFQGFDLYGQFFPEEKKRLEEGSKVLPFGCGPLNATHKRYLSGRRFSPEWLVEVWGIQSAPVFGEWKHRIIIPVVVGGQVQTFVGLDHSGKQEVKYKAAPVEKSLAPTSELVYGGDFVRGTVIVVEGIADVWRMGKGAVATFGMTPGPARVAHLIGLRATHYYVMFDGEPRATANAHELSQKLKEAGGNVNAMVVELPYGDPDDATEDEVASIRYQFGME